MTQTDLADLFPDLHSYWSGRTPDLTGRESDAALAELARAEVAGALPDYHLQEADVLAYLTQARKVARKQAHLTTYLDAMKAHATAPDAPADLWEVGE